MLPWEYIVGATCLFAGYLAGAWANTRSRQGEMLERDALDRLAGGFEWVQNTDGLVFTLPDGDRVVFERGWSTGRWFRR